MSKTCNYKNQLITELLFWIKIERDLKIKDAETTHDYKIAAYKKVLNQIQKIKTINSWEDIKDVKGIGKSIRSKLEQIFKSTHTEAADIQLTCNNCVEKIYGIGPAAAFRLMKDHNILTIEDLYRENSRNPMLLNRVQQIGLKYYNDLLHSIPRKEMDIHNKLLNKILYIDNQIDKDLILSLVGSYRRKAKESFDIDLLLSVQRNTTQKNRSDILKAVVVLLQHHNYIKDVLSLGDRKFMGIVKLPKHKYSRRIDILITGEQEYPFALMYFTGSKEFNIEFRKKAKDIDVVLNEYGIFDKKGRRLNLDIHTELDIFNYFDVPYVDPEYRI